jgi:hypothetical protein
MADQIFFVIIPSSDLNESVLRQSSVVAPGAPQNGAINFKKLNSAQAKIHFEIATIDI